MIPPDTKRRVISGVILAAALVALLVAARYSCAWRGVLIVLGAAATAICAGEFAVMSQSPFGAEGRRGKTKAALYFIVTVIPCLTVLWALAENGWCDSTAAAPDAALLLSRGLTAAIVAAALVLTTRASGALEGGRVVADDLFLAVYHIGLGGAALTWLAGAPQGASQLAWIFLVTALNDTCAFFGGSRFGGKKMAPILSPNKTVSGGICGLLGGALTGVVAGYALGLALPFFSLLILSLAVSLSGQAGDLMKSYLKRLYGVKDSGRIIPGHGGLYDRMDAALFAAPIALLWL